MLQNNDTQRAVYYSRVSTEEEKQLNALVKQVDECERCIKEMGWERIDGYVDEGKSGTATKKRDEYQRLFEDMLTDKFDIICIKDQDRLMRNTKDWYLFVDRLVTTGKRLYMYLENTWYSPDNSLITGIKAIMAEEYSRNLSKKINNSNRRRIDRAKQGDKLSLYGNGLCYGYNFINGELVINEREAEVVRLIYKLYLGGNGLRNIRRILTAQGLKNQRGREFSEVTIANILKDEKKMGTVVCNKTHYDFERKKIVKNPTEEWVYFSDAVPPIINKEDWNRANKLMDSRRDQSGADKRGKKTGDNPLSGKICCGSCGKAYWKREREKDHSITWECSTFAKNGRKNPKRGIKSTVERDLSKGCDSPNIKHDEVIELLADIGEDLVVNRGAVKVDMLKWLNNLLDTVTNGKGLERVTAELNKLEITSSKLLDSFLEGIIPKEAYRKKAEELEQRIIHLKLQALELSKQDEDAEEIQKVIDNLDAELDTYIGGNSFTNERRKFVLEHLLQIRVYESYFVVDIDFMGKGLVAERKSQYVQGTR